MGSIKIEVVGPGCRFCKKLHDLVNMTVAEEELDAEVTYVTDLKNAIRYIPLTPVLKIYGEVAHRGKFLPSKEKLAALLKDGSL